MTAVETTTAIVRKRRFTGSEAENGYDDEDDDNVNDENNNGNKDVNDGEDDGGDDDDNDADDEDDDGNDRKPTANWSPAWEQQSQLLVHT